MTTKLLDFYDFARVIAPPRTALADILVARREHLFPAQRPPVISPVCRRPSNAHGRSTLARWVCPSADHGAGASVEPENAEARQCRCRPRRVGSGFAAARLAA